MSNTVIYLIIGSMFMLCMDLILLNKKEKFTNAERIIGIILWPLALLQFIYYFIKGNNDE